MPSSTCEATSWTDEGVTWGNFIINSSWTLNDCERSHLWIAPKTGTWKVPTISYNAHKIIISQQNHWNIVNICIHVNNENNICVLSSWHFGYKHPKLHTATSKKIESTIPLKLCLFTSLSFWGYYVQYKNIYIYIDIVASRISMNSWHDQSTFLPLLWPIPLGPPCECVAACTVVLVGSESSWSCQTCLRSCQLYKTVSKYCRAPPESNLIECLKQGLTSHKLCWWVKLSNGMAPWWKSARLLIGPRWVWSFSSCWISTKAVFLLQAASSHEQPLSCASLGSNIQKCGCAHTNTRIV